MIIRKQTIALSFAILLSIIKNLDTASDHVNPVEELGDFTLYNHGEIGKYNGYKGMLVALYRVPSDVQVGTWMIKVKPAPDGCSPKRQIYVHLQPGSLPLVNALNESFPDDFLLTRFHSQHRLLVSNDGANHFLNVTHPLPGQWFLIAYYIDTDTSIKQEGLTRSCHSILIVGLQFRLLRRIPELVLNEADEAVEMSADRRTTLFKFFVPQTVISYSISVLNCSSSASSSSASSSSSSDEPYLCPIVLSSRANALPYTDFEYYQATTWSSSVGVNDDSLLSKFCENSHLALDAKNQTHCVLVNEYPVRGSWHYLNITRTDNESDNATLSYAVRLTAHDCYFLYYIPGNDDGGDADRATSRQKSKNDTNDDDVDAVGSNRTVVKTMTTTPPLTTKMMTMATKNASWSSLLDLDDLNATTNSSSSSSSSRSGVSGDVEYLFCPDRVEALFKTEKENHFEFAFVPLREISVGADASSLGYSCPGLCLRDGEVSFYSLRMDPRDDVGGTLKIDIAFYDSREVMSLKAGSSQKQLISICMTKDSTLLRSGGSSDDVECSQRGFPFNLDSKNVSKREITKWIPYPEPGIYFFKFSLRCVDANSGQKVACDPVFIRSTRRQFGGAVLKFNVSSNACIERECGPYGSCAIAYYDKVQFSYCICDESLGYRGYGCTELGPNAPSQTVLILNLVFLIGSNIAFFGAIFIATRRGFYLEAIVYCGVLFFSTFYHACDQPLYYFCLIKGSARRSYDLLQFMDFVSALLALWVTILAVAEFPLSFKLPMVMLGALLVPAMTYYNRFLLQTIVVPLGVAGGITAVSWVVKCIRIRRCFPRQHYSVLHIVPGLLCGVAGIVCFTQATKQNYYVIHSLWHVLMAVAIVCLLPCANKAGRLQDSHMQTDDDDEDDEEDDVCRRLSPANGAAALNNDTDSSTTSGNGNGNYSSGGAGSTGIKAFLFPSRTSNRNVHASSSSTGATATNATAVTVDADAALSSTAENLGFGGGGEAAASSSSSMLGRMLSREEEEGRSS